VEDVERKSRRTWKKAHSWKAGSKIFERFCFGALNGGSVFTRWHHLLAHLQVETSVGCIRYFVGLQMY
jgi:hypothetical protein